MPSNKQGAAFADAAAAIANCGGWLRFDRYLDIVQHGKTGYYGSGRVCFGGDFITAPSISPLFAKALAGQIAQILKHCGGGILELGAGDGALARQILSDSRFGKCSYDIVETSAALRKRQMRNLAGFAVRWHEQLPQTFTGAIIANEVLDCIPFRLLLRQGGEWLELGVIVNDDKLSLDCRPIDNISYVDSLPPDLPNGYQTEICPRAEKLIRQTAASLQTGAALFLDYGFNVREYYHPQRRGGTMMCHHKHIADDNPLQLPGEKDITAHVNFSAMANAAINGGGEFIYFATQAGFLIDCGITGLLAQYCGGDDLRYAKLSAGVQKLLAPHEMGELIKVLAFGKNAPSLTGFLHNDQSARL